MKIGSLLILAMVAASASAQASTDVVCSYAPSQSDLVAKISGVAGRIATAAAVAKATGLTAVAHSSGALILTGSSGYIAGTIGAPASVYAVAVATATAPVIIAVGLIVGGTAVTVELVCAGKNHPEQVAKVNEAAAEFSRRFFDSVQRAKVAATDIRVSVVPAVGRATITAKQVASNVWQYAYQKSSSFTKSFGR